MSSLALFSAANPIQVGNFSFFGQLIFRNKMECKQKLQMIGEKPAKKNLFIFRNRSYSVSRKETLPLKIKRERVSSSKIGLKASTIPLRSINVSSTSWCLFDANNEREIGFRQHYQREVASLTKIMTTFLSLKLQQTLQFPNIIIRVTPTASKLIGTTACLKSGTWIHFKDLLYGAMLPSGNDAAYLLAECMGFLIKVAATKQGRNAIRTVESLDLTAQNTSSFVVQFLRKMNDEAVRLKMSQTSFSNPHGLVNALNVSSARNMITLSMQAMTLPQFRRITNTSSHNYFTYSSPLKQNRIVNLWCNTNKLLKKHQHWQGVKTGQTLSAGCCLSSLRKNIYIVVLNCSNEENRFTETERIYDWYYENHVKMATVGSESEQL